ncbi:MAG: hypothetical protein NC918_04545 [Candidatus Omnitrophica bacterium]|nr:hypothetical protein [Candidatus Omnitrophota bacterium]
MKFFKKIKQKAFIEKNPKHSAKFKNFFIKAILLSSFLSLSPNKPTLSQQNFNTPNTVLVQKDSTNSEVDSTYSIDINGVKINLKRFKFSPINKVQKDSTKKFEPFWFEVDDPDFLELDKKLLSTQNIISQFSAISSKFPSLLALTSGYRVYDENKNIYYDQLFPNLSGKFLIGAKQFFPSYVADILGVFYLLEVEYQKFKIEENSYLKEKKNKYDFLFKFIVGSNQDHNNFIIGGLASPYYFQIFSNVSNPIYSFSFNYSKLNYLKDYNLAFVYVPKNNINYYEQYNLNIKYNPFSPTNALFFGVESFFNQKYLSYIGPSILYKFIFKDGSLANSFNLLYGNNNALSPKNIILSYNLHFIFDFLALEISASKNKEPNTLSFSLSFSLCPPFFNFDSFTPIK